MEGNRKVSGWMVPVDRFHLVVGRVGTSVEYSCMEMVLVHCVDRSGTVSWVVDRSDTVSWVVDRSDTVSWVVEMYWLSLLGLLLPLLGQPE